MTLGDLALLMLGTAGLLVWALGSGLPGTRELPLRLPARVGSLGDARVRRDTLRVASTAVARVSGAYALLSLSLIPLPDTPALVSAGLALPAAAALVAWYVARYASGRARHYRRIDEALRRGEREER